MPAEVKQRKKSQKPNDEGSETPPANGKDEAQKVTRNNTNKTTLDFRSILCLLSLGACAALSW